MPGDRKLQMNGSAINGGEETMRRKVVEDDENGRLGDNPDTYPDRPGEPDCTHFLKTGSCGFGIACRYNHPSNGGKIYDGKNTSELPERAGQPDCGYYMKTGTCKYGSVCKYHHPKDKQADVVMNALGLPMREAAKPCSYYMRTGLCKYGSSCKFHHPPPASTGNGLPVVGHGVSAAVPSSVVELSEPSVPKATYFANSLQLPLTYMPFYVSTPQGWNTYMGNACPLPVTSVATTSHSHNGPMLSSSYLPERPDQPECRYFMNYGSCKYGSGCKYHHPREKVLASGSIGPLGLPLRPGQSVCSYYSYYGLCKYGPKCKFDHPLDGYSYAYNGLYGLSIPPQGPNYSTPGPFRRVAAVSESRSSKSGGWATKGPDASNSDDKQDECASTKDSQEKQDSREKIVIQNGPE